MLLQSNYQSPVNQSLIISDFDIPDSKKSLPNGKLLNYQEHNPILNYETESVQQNLIKLFDEILAKTHELLNEMQLLIDVKKLERIKEIDDEESKSNYQESLGLKKLTESMRSSLKTFEMYFNLFDLNFLALHIPAVEYDYDGALTFEWYGKLGSRLNLEFGVNGELNFVSLINYHPSQKKLFVDKLSLEIIKNDLYKLFVDKFS